MGMPARRRSRDRTAAAMHARRARLAGVPAGAAADAGQSAAAHLAASAATG